MNIHIFILLFIVFTKGRSQDFSDIDNDKFAGPTLHKQLEEETRKAQCCEKKMRCCKKQPPPPNIEIRAVMARCTNPPTYCTKRRKMTKPLYQANTERLTRFQGFDEDEPLVQSEVTKCNKKLILTMKIKNEGETNTRSQFIVIDHVYDPISSMTVRILNPYVIKMKQDHVSQTYPLKFLDFVNSEAREQVYNKHDGNFTGCCMDDKRPTCGLVKYQGRVIPYSGGFCCSCDAQKNAERQPDTEQMEPRIGPSDPAYLMDAVQCPRTNIKEKFLKEAAASKRQDSTSKNDNNNLYYMRQSDSDGRQMYIDYQAKMLRNSFNSDMKDDEPSIGDLNGNRRFGLPAETNYKFSPNTNEEYDDSSYYAPQEVHRNDNYALLGRNDKHDEKQHYTKSKSNVAKEMGSRESGKSDTRKAEASNQRSDVRKPEMSRSDLGKLEVGRSNLGKSEIETSDISRSDIGRSDIGRVDITRSEIGRSDIDGSDISRSEVGRSEIGRPEIARSDITRSDIARPDIARSDISRSDTARSDTARSDISRSEMAKSDISRPDIGRPDMIRSEIDRTDIGKSEIGGTEIDRAEMSRAEIDRDDVGKGGIDKSHTGTAQISKISISKAGIDKTDLKTRSEKARSEKVGSEKARSEKVGSEKARSEKTINEKDKSEQIQKSKSSKPSMHKILNSENMYKPGSLLDFQNAGEEIPSPNNFRHPSVHNDQTIVQTGHTLDENQGPSVEDEDLDLLESIYSKRQVQSSGVQRRGGQNCADRYTPPHLNPETYHESAHCLRFSPVWYGVYKIDKPVVEQEIVIQIFEKYETESGQTRWKDITDGKKIRLGTFSPYYKDEIPTISLTFNSMYNDEDFCVEWKKMRLLIPEGMRVADLVKYAEAKGGPAEYLIVNADKIVLSGEQCDVAGVGFEAFFKQRNRCSMPRGTCLHHQPKHMWMHDKKMERAGKKGCYFLKYHGKLSKNPIRKNMSSDERYLTLNYYGRYISMIDMEVNADFNAVLRPSSTGVITEVYIDSTCPTRTHITIKLTNGGLLSSKFMVRICDCPLDLKGQLNNLKSDLVLIAPQNQHVFKLTVYNKLEVDIFHCSVEALNCKGELVALRRIRIQKMDRCICTWHCLCACIGSTKGLKCIAMKLDHFHAAGFRGGLPTTVYAEHEMSTDDIIRITIYLIIFIFITLLLLGLTKGLIGLCCLPIGAWGLNLLLDLPKPMKQYYESNLRDHDVVYDSEGWPVHPETGERVRNLPATAEFCANVLFFYTYPTVVLLLVIKRLCCPGMTDDGGTGGGIFKKKCEANCSNKQTQADSDSNTSLPAEKGKRKLCDKLSKGPKKKATIKVSINPRNKPNDPDTPARKRSGSPKVTKNADAYYFSSTDEGTTSSK